MYNGLKILSIIPARAGSKGVKNKNIIEICGKPLIVYTIEAAKNSKYIDEVIVSTDGDIIADVSKRNGASVPFLRPAELASDQSKTIDCIIHVINKLSETNCFYDVIVLLQPTSPLRTAEDIDGAIIKFFNYNQQSLVSVSKVEDHPLLIRTIDKEGFLHGLISASSTCRRQDMPLYYKVNGAIYINRADEINVDTSLNDNIIPYIIEESHAIDIDTEFDFIMATQLLENRM